MPKKRSYWYKGLAQLFSGLPTTIEGGLTAKNHSDALKQVKAMATVWAVKKLHTIRIYEMPDGLGGEVSPNPVVEMNNTPLLNTETPKVHTHMNNVTFTHDKEETLVEKYDNALFTLGTDLPKTFNTVTIEE